MKLLVSACLLGLSCRYDGNSRPMNSEDVDNLMLRFELIPVCPECFGGLPTPRPPSEVSGGRIISSGGEDVTEAFQKGARETLYLAKLFGCGAALLKEKSPSCGREEIYDGTFTKTIVSGSGVTAELLMENGIEVYGESQLDELFTFAERR